MAEIAEMLRSAAGGWTAERVRAMIAAREVPDDYAWTVAEYIAEHPSLAVVSDEEFLGGVRLVNPACAAVFNTPAGLDWMHRASPIIAYRLFRTKLGLGRYR